MRAIKIYSTPACPYCQRLKSYLDSMGFAYKDIDVSVNPEIVEEMVNLSGQMGVPVIVVDDEVIIGFDRERLDSLLKE